MKLIKNRIRAALLILFIGATALSGGVLWALNQHLKKVSVIEQGDPLWIAAQMQFELLRLKDALYRYANETAAPRDVSLRFDIAWSRINVMQTGRMGEVASALQHSDDPINALEKTFETIEPLIMALPETPTAARAETAETLLSALRPYDLRLREFAIVMAQSKAERLFNFRANGLSLSRAIAYLFTGLMMLAMTFCVFLLLDLRESRATSAKLEKLAEEANSASAAKDKFMSAVSHELRTPLTSIRGGIGLLKKSFETLPVEQAKKLISIAERNCERLLTLVNDILDAQKIMEGKVTLRLARTDISQTVQAAIEDCHPFAEQYNVTYQLDLRDAPLMAVVDEDRISQVVCNLLSNAAKFSKPNDEIIVRAYKSGDLIKVEVEDHGVGIASAEHASIFTRFHQISPGETGPNKSSGLGLSISKELIEMHGGQIGFSSDLGEGATFAFCLKNADAAA